MDLLLLNLLVIGAILLASYAAYRVGLNEGRGTIQALDDEVILTNIDLVNTKVSVDPEDKLTLINCKAVAKHQIPIAKKANSNIKFS